MISKGELAERDAVVDEAVARRIGVAWREMRRGAAMLRLRARLYGDELELGQADALDVVAQQGPCRMRELADALRVDASTATRAVQRLEEAGLARRKADGADARCVVVTVTDKGQRLCDRVQTRGKTALRQILEEFDPEERAQLAELLDRFVRAVDHYASDST